MGVKEEFTEFFHSLVRDYIDAEECMDIEYASRRPKNAYADMISEYMRKFKSFLSLLEEK